MTRDYGWAAATFGIEAPPTGENVTLEDLTRWCADTFQKIEDQFLLLNSGTLFVPLPAEPAQLPIGQGILAYFAQGALPNGEGFYVYEQNAWKKLT